MKMKAPDSGIYPGVAWIEYEAWDAANNSLLRILHDRSPAHGKEWLDNPLEPTDAFVFGHALHCRILETDKFPERFILAPDCDRRTKAGKELYAAFEAGSGGKQILKAPDYDCIQKIAAQIEKHKAMNFVKGGAAEVCIVWEDRKTKVLCKARLDYIHAERGIMVDIKTTRDASPDDFARSIYQYGYYQQVGFYADGWETLTGDPLVCVILACEKEPPYAIAVYELHEEILYAGRNAYEKALKTYAKCRETGEWPSYFEGVQILNLPKWALEKAGVGPHNLQV